MAGDIAAVEVEALDLVGNLDRHPVSVLFRGTGTGAGPLDPHVDIFRVVGHLYCDILETRHTGKGFRLQRVS